eukprot:Selendium_serpulae@DN4712_c0_g1_i2.p1
MSEGQRSNSSSKARLPAGVKNMDEMMLKVKGMTVDELKRLLKSNDQCVSGNRSELIERVIDRVIQGRIPRCPLCHNKTLRFCKESGRYTCRGSSGWSDRKRRGQGTSERVECLFMGLDSSEQGDHPSQQNNVKAQQAHASVIVREPWKW